MKKKVIVFLSWLIVMALSFSQASVFAEAEAAADEIQNQQLSESIANIAESLEVFARYDEVDRLSLYKSAMKTILEENPELYETVLRAMLSSIDENSAYYNADEAKKLLEKLSDEVTGIGVNVLSSNGSIIVSQPIPDSPADKAGIKAGDIIIRADGVDLRGMDFDMALDYVRGPEGTTVDIDIIRSGISEPLTFSIMRTKVVSDPTDYELIEHNGKKIAKITVYSFTDTSLEHFKAALAKADVDGTKNIIIDVRYNGGGYLEQAVGIADLFLPKDAVITTEDHKLDVLDKKYVASGNGGKYKVVMLINGMSASASEVLTAALRENDAAKVIGEQSFGKGTVQTMVGMQDGAVLKYTTAYYLTPLGNNIHKVGIMPDAVVENSTKPVDMSEFEMFSLQNKYKKGDISAEIANAKKMLKKIGIYVGEINEVFDENLKIAVATYQKIQGLFSYGVLDITTQYNLYETLKNMEEEVDDQLQAAIDAF